MLKTPPPSVLKIAELIRATSASTNLNEAIILKEAKKLQKNWAGSSPPHAYLHLPRAKKPVINGTGIILHTGLGRAPLGSHVIERINQTLSSYIDLEFDLQTGKRGKRTAYLDALFETLNSFYKPVWTNNCASAVLLTLSTLKKTGLYQSVIMSRGEMVEIGGGFRIPEIMEEAGLKILEVGTTNRTSLKDFEKALKKWGPAIVCRVSPSNFTIEGFTESVEPFKLSTLCKKYRSPLLYDAGTLNGDELKRLPKGFDFVMSSCDKTFGGPQGGLICTTIKWQKLVLENPLFRAFRLEKISLVALEAALECHAMKTDRERIPVSHMLNSNLAQLEERVSRLLEKSDYKNFNLAKVSCVGSLGGGSTAHAKLPSLGLQIRPKTDDEKRGISTVSFSAANIVRRLRLGHTSLLLTVTDTFPTINLMTVFKDQDAKLLEALQHLDQTLS